MSKNKKSSTAVVDHDSAIPGPDFMIPSGEPVIDETTEPIETADEAPPQYVEQAELVQIQVPLGAVPPDVYIGRHVEVRLTHDQARVLRSLWYGLQVEGATLAGGKSIDSNADVIRWLLERIAAAEE